VIEWETLGVRAGGSGLLEVVTPPSNARTPILATPRRPEERAATRSAPVRHDGSMNVRRVLLTTTGAGAATAALVGASIAWHVRRHAPLLEQVAADLRGPSLAAPLSVKGPATLRLMRRLLSGESALVEGVEVTEERAGDVRVLVYRPQDVPAGAAALLWLHGGGFVMGRPEVDHQHSSWLAAELGIVVVSVDYRLAPEHPFPAGLDDASTALTWTHENAESLGIDPGRIAVGGASAGAGMAAGLAQRAHDEGRVPVAFQLLIYPMLDDRTPVGPLGRRPWLVWTAASNRFGWTSYLGRPAGGADAPAYAAAARRPDLAGLPTAWVGVGDVDQFHDEAVHYAERLESAGVSCGLHVVPGMFHGADSSFADTAETTRQFRSSLLAAARAGLADPR